jgi:hypothetical protein
MCSNCCECCHNARRSERRKNGETDSDDQDEMESCSGKFCWYLVLAFKTLRWLRSDTSLQLSMKKPNKQAMCSLNVDSVVLRDGILCTKCLIVKNERLSVESNWCQHNNFKCLPLNYNTFHIHTVTCVVACCGKFGDRMFW